MWVHNTEHSPMSDSVDESTSPDTCTITQPIENQESTSTNQPHQPDPVPIPTSSSATSEQPNTDIRCSTRICVFPPRVKECGVFGHYALCHTCGFMLLPVPCGFVHMSSVFCVHSVLSVLYYSC